MNDQASLSLPAAARVLFASDMHLGEHDPVNADSFLRSLDKRVRGCTHLILLGDLFDAWIGDDQEDPVAQRLVAALAGLAAGTSIYVMRGNRDFLLDVACDGTSTAPAAAANLSFSQRASVSMLADPCLLRVGDATWLLAHGDALCTDDTAYQAFRRESREPGWQKAFLSRPLAERTRIAHDMRVQSEQEKSRKPENLTDVNDRAARACLIQAGASRLIHGHTHRPGHHTYRSSRGDWQRWVLPDWDNAEDRGGYLLLQNGTLTDIDR